MRSYLAFVTAAAAFVSPVAGAAERYEAQLAHSADTEWIGFAEIDLSDAAAVRGELCLVRKEYPDRRTEPRTLLRVPVTGRAVAEGLELNLGTVRDGPRSDATLAFARGTGDGGEGALVFGDLLALRDKEGNPILGGTKLAYAELTPLVPPSPDFEISMLSSASDQQVAILLEEVNPGQGPVTALVPLEEYENFTREQAIAFEQKHEREMLYDAGAVVALMDSAKIPQLQRALDALGDGARVMNGEISACHGGVVQVTVSVPPMLEFWYTRQIQKSGAVITAYPWGLPLDPGWTDPLMIQTAAVVAAFGNPRIAMAQKYRPLWETLKAALTRFAAARRPGFAQSGTIVLRPSGAPHVFNAEIRGRSLAVCQANRWEQIFVEATVNPSVTSSSAVGVSLQMSDGFYARGATMPSDARMRDHRISDSELKALQDLMVGNAQKNLTWPAAVRCQQ